MMKSFILAATSIVYILSAVGFADANIKKSIVNKEQTCVDRTAKSTEAYGVAISIADILDICQNITDIYKGSNILGANKEIYYQSPCRSGNRDSEECQFGAFEVNKISFSPSSSLVYTTVNLEVIRREYKWTNQGWTLDRKRTIVFPVNFYKENNKWTYKTSDIRY